MNQKTWHTCPFELKLHTSVIQTYLKLNIRLISKVDTFAMNY